MKFEKLLKETPKEVLQKIATEKQQRTGELDLSSCNLTTIPEEVLELVHLKYLNLSDNQLSDCRSLENLIHLQYLNLDNNQLLDCRFLKNLTHLQTLDLGINQLSDCRGLENLTNLQTLNLAVNQLSDCRDLENLTHLQTLNLGINQLSDCRFLEKLTKLQYLYLSHNQLSDCRGLENLTNLQSLNLSRNQLSDCRGLENLPNLEVLYLSNNQLSDCRGLENLPNLQHLNLSDNQLSDCRFLKNLTHLQTLDLSFNQLSDCRGLENLPNLQHLNLSDNQLSDCRGLENLTHLQFLNLWDNQISQIDALENLTNLKTLDLSNNKIKALPDWVVDRQFEVKYEDKYTLESMSLYGNPITNPPLEIVKKGNDAIKKYFEDLEQQGTGYLYEAKLLIVGDGGAGKTTLARKMENLNCEMPEKSHDRTQGIDIKAMPIRNIKNAEPKFLMNVWDFGGQGYYHSTHQFFLTKRSLYVLLNNTRTNQTDYNHWLQTISLFSANSPVIIVENEEGNAKSGLDLKGLQAFFENILYSRNADLSNIDDGRVEKLINDIHIEIQRLPHIGNKLPKKWVEIRNSIKKEAETNTYISDKRFYEICKTHKIEKKEAIHRVSDLFHDLGVFLHFRDDKVLKKIVILQNAWATKGIYTILDNELVRTQNGYFTMEQAETIWEDTPYEEMHDEFISLMEKFKLCYRIPYASPDAYISPNLLPTQKPDYAWDNHQNVVIYYQYDFMPKGLLGMLIVELHRFVKDIKKMAWQKGCVFHHENTDAQVIETYGNKKIEIRIKGDHCVRLSSIIMSEMDKINDSFERIKVNKFVPCPCKKCQVSDEPHKYNYQRLMKRKADKKDTIECELSYEQIRVEEILEATYNENYAKEINDLKELIRTNKTKDAINLIEQDYPREGASIMSDFNELEINYIEGIINLATYNMGRRTIHKKLLKLSENKAD